MRQFPASRPSTTERLLGTALVIAAVSGFSPLGATEIPRRADGRPDLSGTYNVATLTPLVRPARFGDNLSLSEAEAAEFAKHWQDNLAKDATPSDPNRQAPPEGGVDFFVPEFNGAAGGVGGYNAFFIDLGDNMFKIDGKYRTSIIIDPPNGQMPPLTEEGKRHMMADADDRHPNTGEAWWLGRESGPYDDPEKRPLAERCLLGFGSTSGPPALPVMYNNLKRVVQTEDYIVLVNEMNHDARVIRIDDRPEPENMRRWLGDSVGRWEGDTLVVETANFRHQLGFSRASENLRVEERFSRLDDDTLLYRFTVDDPTVWSEPWTGEYPWPQTDDKVYEYACHEGNYALGNILRGARVLEGDALEGSGSSGSGD